MTTWKVKIEIDADSLADAQQLIAEREQGRGRGQQRRHPGADAEIPDERPRRAEHGAHRAGAPSGSSRHCLASDDEIEIDDDSIVS